MLKTSDLETEADGTRAVALLFLVLWHTTHVNLNLQPMIQDPMNVELSNKENDVISTIKDYRRSYFPYLFH